MTLHFQILPPLFFCLWPMRAPLWQTDLREKCFLSTKNTTFFNFRRTDFPKAPLCGFKNTPFTCLSAFFAPWASARQLSRMRRLGKIVLLSFPISSLVIGLATIDFIRFFQFCGKMLPPHKENTCLCKNYLSVRVPHPSCPAAVMPFGRLHFGHFATSAVVGCVALAAQNMVLCDIDGPRCPHR